MRTIYYEIGDITRSPRENDEEGKKVGTAINFILVMLGFCSVSIGVFVFKKKKLFIVFMSVGLVLFAYPFVMHKIYTRDAYNWNIVVHRETDDPQDARVIFVRDIEWITDYEKLKRQRGDVRSFFLDEDTTEKEFVVKGFVPLSIEADIVYGPDQKTIYRDLEGLKAGSYTFTLTFDENDRGSWSVLPSDVVSNN